ncbi:MAG: DUF5666 domain-containing protein [Ktedonobacteraceae bacterium]
MRIFRIRGKTLASLLFLFLGAVILAACGSNSATAGTSTASPASATATACAQARTKIAGSVRATTGTLQSINGTTLVIATQQGKDVTLTYSSSTRFTQQSAIPATSLKEGTYVMVVGSNANSTYTATRITVTTASASRSGGFPQFSGTPRAGFSGSNPCFKRGQFGAPGAGQPGSASNFRGLIGTVSQISSNTLTLTDTTGAIYSVAITAQTQILQTSSVTAAALKTGMALTATGTTGSNGVVSARTVTILLKLPTSTKSTS